MEEEGEESSVDDNEGDPELKTEVESSDEGKNVAMTVVKKLKGREITIW